MVALRDAYEAKYESVVWKKIFALDWITDITGIHNRHSGEYHPPTDFNDYFEPKSWIKNVQSNASVANGDYLTFEEITYLVLHMFVNGWFGDDTQCSLEITDDTCWLTTYTVKERIYFKVSAYGRENQ